MDSGVYPDAALREITKSFVCIRVGFDENADIVKQYSVSSLPDLRLIDVSGAEKSKLIGFTGAAKLATVCRSVLEGKTNTAEGPRPPVKPAASSDEALRRAVEYLKSSSGKGWKEAPGFEPDAIVLFALASAGLDSKDDDVKKLAASVTAKPPVTTYQAALRALALLRLDAKANRASIEACAKFLLESQLENGQWTYNPPLSGAPPQAGDNSNTAYALLGLAAAKKSGLEVPEVAVRRAEKTWRSTQNADGGWGYRMDREKESYASMTESGASSLSLCRLMLGVTGDDDAVARATKWLATNFSVRENAKSGYQQGRLLYHLYALERAGSLLAVAAFGDHDWVKEGEAFLLSTQRDDGSWDDGAETPLSNTCFAMLFLTRSTRHLK